MSIAIELTRALPTATGGDHGHLAVDAVGVGVFADALDAQDLPDGIDPGFLEAQGFTATAGSS